MYEIEVGRSGEGTLKVLDGAAAITSVLNVGNGAGTGTVLVDDSTGVTTTLTSTGTNIGGYTVGSTGQITVTGAKAKYDGGVVDVGSAGTGTLTVFRRRHGKGHFVTHRGCWYRDRNAHRLRHHLQCLDWLGHGHCHHRRAAPWEI